MKRFLCLSMFVALTLMSDAAFAADECTKITATGHRYYPAIAYKDGDKIVGAAQLWSRPSPSNSTCLSVEIYRDLGGGPGCSA